MAMNSHEEIYRENRIEDALLTVKDLLSFPTLNKSRILAGARGLTNPVKRLNIIEDRNITARYRTGEFVMTTGYIYHAEPHLLVQLISELATQGVSALGIQTKPYMDALPIDVIEEAERQGLPLLELSVDTLFSDMTKEVSGQLDIQVSIQLVDLQNCIQGFTSLLLEGRGLFTLLDAMEESRGHPIAIVRANGRPWLSKSLRGADSADRRSLTQALTTQLQDQPTNVGFMELNQTRQMYVKIIPMHNTAKLTYMVILSHHQVILPVDALIVDRLSPLIGLELATVEAIREIEGRYLDPFLQDWLSGKFVSHADWKLRADVCGYSIPKGAQIIAVLVNCSSPDRRERQKEMISRIRSEQIQCMKGVLVTAIGEDLALLLPVDTRVQNDAVEDQFLSLLNQLSSELQSLLNDQDLKLYAGRANEGSEGVSLSWAQAKRARHVAQVCGLTDEVVAYDKLGVYSLLYMIPTGEEREQFLTRFTAPLKNADRKGGGRLMETLEMFYLCNGNIKLTSEKLVAHYNTVVYRLEKIQTILGISLDDPEDRLQLHLAIKLYKLNF